MSTSDVMAAAAAKATMFRPATRQKCRLRMAIDGVSGSGKTFSALRFAFAFGPRVAVVNAESGAIQKYLGLAPDGIPWQFDICDLQDFAPTAYTAAILTAGQLGYDVLIIDSLSHAWAGSGGALEIKDKKADKGNSFTAWKDVTPMHNRMIEAILRSPCHVIATMRSKTAYVLQINAEGKQVPVKVGMEPVQRQGMEYEFDIYASIDADHIIRVSKSRCPEMTDAIAVKPSMDFIRPVVAWVNEGSDVDRSFFAVTDGDLRKLEKASAADQPEAPKKTAQELMREAAERAAQPEGSPSNPEWSTVAQTNEIRELFEKLGIDHEAQEEILAKKSCKSLRNLTFAQAQEMLEKLRAAERQVAAESQDHATDRTPPVEEGSKVHGPCTADQVAAIKRLAEEIEQMQPGITGKVVAKLKESGIAKLADMTFDEARILESALRVKNLEEFLIAKVIGFKPGN